MSRASRSLVLEHDRAHVWHPYTPVEHHDEREPLVVSSAAGAWLTDRDGRRFLDGNSSWWVAALGHGHPRLLRVLAEQSQSLVHCSLAGITHEPAALLASELCAVAPPGLTRVFYTDNGSTAVEAAVKIALQAWQQRGARKKTGFVALDGAFHGDTVGASSLGGIEVFRRPFAGVLFDCVHAPFPDPSAHERAFDAIAAAITRAPDTIAAVIVEPVVQGAAGMRMYDAALLRELRALCDRWDVLLVFDEVFTGYGRTGRMWAAEHAGVSPDLMCIGKAFASLLPMGATLATNAVVDAFRGGRERALLYGHTFCGHPLGAALAREVLAIYRDEDVVKRTGPKAARIADAFARMTDLRGVARVRTMGMIGAADLSDGGYLGQRGWRVYDEGLARGAYLRPLGDTVYVCPPLNISDDDLDALLGIVEESIRAVV